jgi:hypothetical protein
MARKFLVSIDLNKNELQNAVIQNLATAPASPVAGQVYYNTTDNQMYIYNGTRWEVIGNAVLFGLLASRPAAGSVDSGTIYYATDNYLFYYSNGSTWQQTNAFSTVTAQTSYGASSGDGSSTNYARADHTHGTPSLGTATPNAISGAAGGAGSGTVPSKQDHTHAFTPSQDLSMATYKLTNLGTPTADTDAATKAYVDGVAQGLDVKASVRAGTTTAGTLATSFANTSVIDGVTLATGNRILIKNQATASENGIYTVNATGAPTRATDMDTAAEFAGAFTFVEEGTTLADTGWVCTTNNPVTVGTTAINWSQFSSAGSYTASNGILLTGSNFTFAPTSTGGLQTAAGGASILKPTNSGLVTDATGLYVGAGTGISVSGTTVALTNTAVTVNGTSIALGSSGTVTANTTNALTLGTGLTGTSFNGSAAVTAAIDTSVVVRKYATSIGDGSATSYTITHSLGTRDVTVAVYDNSSPYAEVLCDINHATTNTITALFTVAPTSNQYRVVVQA